MAIKVALRSVDGQYYMCAEGGGGREIVANRRSVGPWETFWLHFADLWNNIVYLRTFDNQHVLTAKYGGGDLVVANQNQVGPWELFKLDNFANNLISLQASNGQYVCFDQGGNDLVIANRNKRGPWESIFIEVL
ncbi:hypothetical protein MUG84_04230 [Paenibacillus sp. KQZ6P-2]|uniref:DUF7910 domain-containing protein n=1 Tax=Paenibacillus mangrovi TaxID=2931978 RepID=A0A9X2B3V0_9BACL|nr:hypothetical protein [Paenibacillus mangrovi]MCJ8010952.1 hypothetical protein [Paenibacillus mangrovi]